MEEEEEEEEKEEEGGGKWSRTVKKKKQCQVQCAGMGWQLVFAQNYIKMSYVDVPITVTQKQ